jgi:predicted transcriptional regulator of viral defense system
MALEVPNKTFITPVDLRKRYGRFDPNVWSRWQEKEKVRKLRNGLYMNKSHEIHGDWDAFTIASFLYSPSYVSLYSAFRFYNLIPESVFEITSVCTKKTAKFHSYYNYFFFRQIQPNYFFGYKIEAWRGSYFAIAYLEKAILDMAYLDPDFSDAGYLEEMRFDEDVLNENISWGRMNRYLQVMNSNVLTERIDLLKKVYEL